MDSGASVSVIVIVNWVVKSIDAFNSDLTSHELTEGSVVGTCGRFVVGSYAGCDFKLGVAEFCRGDCDRCCCAEFSCGDLDCGRRFFASDDRPLFTCDLKVGVRPGDRDLGLLER